MCIWRYCNRLYLRLDISERYERNVTTSYVSSCLSVGQSLFYWFAFLNHFLVLFPSTTFFSLTAVVPKSTKGHG